MPILFTYLVVTDELWYSSAWGPKTLLLTLAKVFLSLNLTLQVIIFVVICVPRANRCCVGEWAKVVHDQTVTWLANWKENVNGNFKYVFLAAGSSIKGASDMSKFEKARELKVCSPLDNT